MSRRTVLACTPAGPDAPADSDTDRCAACSVAVRVGPRQQVARTKHIAAGTTPVVLCLDCAELVASAVTVGSVTYLDRSQNTAQPEA